ncbi:hypothetical protein K443DRAFT_483659, partial [Laccaria amethystina LaAM-08-1]
SSCTVKYGGVACVAPLVPPESGWDTLPGERRSREEPSPMNLRQIFQGTYVRATSSTVCALHIL